MALHGEGLSLRERIETLFSQAELADNVDAREAFFELRKAMSAGEIRAAEPDASAPGGWRVNAWVKQGILLGFRFGVTVDASADHGKWPFYDKDTLILKNPGLDSGVRIVPGGSTARDGAFIGHGVICMPPMFINIGAYIGEGSLVDSHALVGSCAQIGKRVHLSAAAQIGGVIEPVGALPVVIEDDVLVGGNTGVYEGAIIKERAVIAAGTDACSGGFAAATGEVAGGVDRVLPVDVYVPGSPPSPIALLHGLLLAVGRLAEATT